MDAKNAGGDKTRKTSKTGQKRSPSSIIVKLNRKGNEKYAMSSSFTPFGCHHCIQSALVSKLNEINALLMTNLQLR